LKCGTIIDLPKAVAARFGTSAASVRQRLKLASVSPVLIELYRADEMSLDQLMAFAVSEYPSAEGRLARAWFGSEAALLRSSLRAQLAAQHEPSDGFDRPGASSLE
jgi:hypothetical protein